MAETFRSLSSGQELSIAVEFAPKYFQEHFHFFANIFIILIRTKALDTKKKKKKKVKKKALTWLHRAIHGHHEYGLHRVFLQLLFS